MLTVMDFGITSKISCLCMLIFIHSRKLMDKPGSPGGLAKKKNTQQQNKNSGEVCFKLLVSAFSIND